MSEEFQRQLQDASLAIVHIIQRTRADAAKSLFDNFSELHLSPPAYEAAVEIYQRTNEDIKIEADTIRDQLHELIRQVASSRSTDEVWGVLTSYLTPLNSPGTSIYNPDRTINWQKVAFAIKNTDADNRAVNIAIAKALREVYKTFWVTPAS